MITITNLSAFIVRIISIMIYYSWNGFMSFLLFVPYICLIFFLLFADAIIPITCFILVCLFALQHYGTHRVGFFFAPIILVWLLCLSGLGLYNIFHWNRHIYKALSPCYMLKFLKKTKKGGWMSLGGILLCITGTNCKETFLFQMQFICVFWKNKLFWINVLLDSYKMYVVDWRV